jgi:hypothetical protein
MAGERPANPPPVVLAGAPRTGTTWIASVMAQRPGVAWVNEPDNEWPNPYTLRAKLRLGRFPVLTAAGQAPRAYAEVWRRALAGLAESPRRQQVAWKLDRGEPTALELWRAMCDHASPAVSPRLRLLVATSAPPSHRVPGRDVLVKSVFAPLALEWLAAAFAPRIVVVLRHPLNVLSSWVSLRWGGCALEANPRVRTAFGERWGLPKLADDASSFERIAWEVGLFTSALWEAADRTDLVVRHDDLCRDPRRGFEDLFAALGWTWAEEAERFLAERDRPGEGFETMRVAAEQPDVWRRRLSAEQVADAWDVLARFRSPWVAEVEADLA